MRGRDSHITVGRNQNPDPRAKRLGPTSALVVVFLAVGIQAGTQGTMTAWITPSDSLLFSALAFMATTVLFGLLSAAMRTRRTEPEFPMLTMVLMNIATAITFLSFYASISMIPAATSGALESAFGPIAIAVLSFVTARGVSSRAQWITAVTLVALGIFLGARTWDDSAVIGTTALGALLAVIAGWGMAAITLLSRHLGQRRISPVTVTAHRFHVGYLAAFSIWAMSSPQLPTPQHVLLLLGLGVLATGIPLFLLQIGVQRAQPFSAMLVIMALPALTYPVQLASGVPADPFSMLLIIAIIAVSAFGVLRTSRGTSSP